MKAFTFRLHRVLQLRQSQLEAEESKLEQLFTVARGIEKHIDSLEDSVRQARSSTYNQQFVRRSDLVGLERFAGRIRRESGEAKTKLKEQNQAIERQQAVVVSVRGRVRLLEKLREKQETEWQLESNREVEALAQEFSAAQWARARRERNRQDQAVSLTGVSKSGAYVVEAWPSSE